MGQLTGSGFDLAWISSLSFERLCIFDLNGATYIYIFFLVTFFTSPFNKLFLSGLAFDLVD